MKFIKNILSIALLCAVGSINPRVARTTRPIGPIPPRVTTVPSSVIQPQSYAQALHIIKTQMPPHKVLSNNTFTQEFVDFVKSLNLSDIETKALLEAGVNIHATWTDNNEINKQLLLSLKNDIQSIAPTKVIVPAQPIVQPRPIAPTAQPILLEQASSITMKDKTHRDLLGKVEKLKGYEIYVGAGTSPAREPIFFAMEKLDKQTTPVWEKYTKALLDYNKVLDSLYILNETCNDPEKLQNIGLLRLDDPYTTRLLERICPNQQKFANLFGKKDGIGGGVAGFELLLDRQKEGNTIYVAYASNEPVTGPFKPKKEIALSSFTLEDFEIAYSNLILCVGVDMLENLKTPVSTEHRGIFKNPFNEIQGTYKNIAMKLHGWAGTVEMNMFKKQYMTLFPTLHAAKLLHRSIKNGGLYLGTDKEPFRYGNYYKDPNEQQLIKEKFPPIKQERIGDTPTTAEQAALEDLHVFELKFLSKYYTGK